MKIDNSLIDKSKYENVILRRAGFDSREAALQAAKNQRDRFEYTGIREGYACEQYNDLGAKLVKSGEVKLGIPSSIKRDMLNCMEEYYRGECSDEELAEAYLKFCEQTGVGDKARLLDVYENFLNMSRYAANNVCSQKGNDITAKYGSVDEHDAVYYNADFYYSFEKVKDIAKSASEAVAEAMDWGELDFAERENNTIFKLDGDFSFNGKWAWNAQNLMNRCTMINPNLAPPKGFEFYYKERKYADSEVGVTLIGTGNGYQKITVPFEAPRAGVSDYVQKFNAADLCRLTEKDTGKYEEYNEFLKNFDIYTRYYFKNTVEKNL